MTKQFFEFYTSNIARTYSKKNCFVVLVVVITILISNNQYTNTARKMSSDSQPNLEQLQQENAKLKEQIDLLQSCVRDLYDYANSGKPIGDICNICEECYTAYRSHYDAKDCCLELKKEHNYCYFHFDGIGRNVFGQIWAPKLE